MNVSEPSPAIRQSAVINVLFGETVKVIMPSNLYGCEIGDNSFVGPFVEIQSGVVIGRRCRIQSHTFICELVSIGDDTFVGHGVMFVNDLFRTGGPASGDRSLWGSTRIGSHVSIGSNATILPVRICDGCVVGAGAVVTRDLLIAGSYAGNPARLIRKFETAESAAEVQSTS